MSAILCFCLAPFLIATGAVSAVEPFADAPSPPEVWHRYEGWRVREFVVEGLPAGLAAEVLGGLHHQGEWRLLRSRSRPPFGAAALREDVRRIRLYLARRGYPSSRIEVWLGADARSRELHVLLRVTTGPPVVLRRLRLEGWPAGLAPPDTADSRLPQAGLPLVDDDVARGVRYVRGLLQDAGYAEVEVAVDLEPVQPDSVDVILAVAPGARYIIGTVEVDGCSADLVPLARRVMNVSEGTVYSASMLIDAATGLRSTRLFGRVDLQTHPLPTGDLQLTAHLTDARWRTWRAAVGTWTDNPWVVQAGWNHRNLFGGGVGGDVHGTYATHLQVVGAAVFRLGWLAPRARTSLGGRWRREDEDSYLAHEYQLELVQSFLSGERGRSSVGVAVSNVEVETRVPGPEDVPRQQDWLAEIWFDRKWDWTDDLLYPTRGGFLKTSVTLAPPWPLDGSPYLRLQVDGTALRGLGRRFVAAWRGRCGWVRPLGGRDDVLVNRRFYAGGYNSMRGYGRRELGPLDAEGNPRGGRMVLLLGAELRARLVGIFDAAAFVDAGQVWERPDDVAPADLATAVGVNLDLRTPLGPLRVGHAWNLSSTPEGAPTAIWHVGIGYPW